MRGLQRTWTAVFLGAALVASGCNGPSKRTLASTEPGLATLPDESGVTVVDRARPIPRTDTVVDRHPLFSKPRQYYNNTNRGKATKTASAVVLGVPAGIYGELKQIVVGAPTVAQ